MGGIKNWVSRGTLDLQNIGSASIINSLPDGVYITDTNRRIVFWNNEAERITGWPAMEVVGRCCRDNILCHVDKDGHLLCGREHCPLHRAMVTGKRSELPRLIFAQHKDGRRIPVEVSVSPILNEGGLVVGGIEVFRDLSPAFQDLNRARLIQKETVQMQIDPDDRLRIQTRYTPHDQVGGDYYRVEHIAHDRYAILLADVIGHGIPAALYTMELRSLWEAGRKHVDSPAVFLEWLSRRVEPLRDANAGYFATAIHSVYDPMTGVLQVGLAGHPAPLIIRKDGSIEEMSGGGGPGLGLLANPSFAVASIDLQPRDQVLLFTDGAIEINNADGEALDVNGLVGIVRQCRNEHGRIQLSALEEKLLMFSNGLSLSDDLTFILLERVL